MDPGPWQGELLVALTNCAERQPNVVELWILGSARQPELMDRWSDVDVGLVLRGPVELASLLPASSDVWAMDRQRSDVRSTCRIVLDDGRRIDLVVAPGAEFERARGRCAYAGAPTTSATPCGTLMTWEPSDAAVNEVRFIAAQAVVKYGRGDRLIGSHLTFELAQLCLVQAMLLRDRDEGTTSHRFGTPRDDLAAEVWAVLRDGSRIDATRVRPLLDVFDRLHVELDETYVPDWAGLESL